MSAFNATGGGGIATVRAAFYYQQQKDDELSFLENDIVEVLETNEGGWWRGRCRGKEGMFPANHVDQAIAKATSQKLGGAAEEETTLEEVKASRELNTKKYEAAIQLAKQTYIHIWKDLEDDSLTESEFEAQIDYVIDNGKVEEQDHVLTKSFFKKHYKALNEARSKEETRLNEVQTKLEETCSSKLIFDLISEQHCPDLNCPISGELMTDPLVDREGNSYNRASILAWIKKNPISPITRNSLSEEDLVPNRSLKNIVTWTIDKARASLPAYISPTHKLSSNNLDENNKQQKAGGGSARSKQAKPKAPNWEEAFRILQSNDGRKKSNNSSSDADFQKLMHDSGIRQVDDIEFVKLHPTRKQLADFYNEAVRARFLTLVNPELASTLFIEMEPAAYGVAFQILKTENVARRGKEAEFAKAIEDSGISQDIHVQYVALETLTTLALLLTEAQSARFLHTLRAYYLNPESASTVSVELKAAACEAAFQILKVENVLKGKELAFSKILEGSGILQDIHIQYVSRATLVNLALYLTEAQKAKFIRTLSVKPEEVEAAEKKRPAMEAAAEKAEVEAALQDLFGPHKDEICRNLIDSQKKLTLLYKASRDGFSAQSFHAKCDNRGATLTLFRTTSGRIAGGYTPTSWSSSDSWPSVPQGHSFIFSVAGNNVTKYYNNKNPGYSMYCGPNYGPIFGSGNDIVISNNSNSNTSSGSSPGSYDIPSDTSLVGSRNFQTNEVEVFQMS